MRIRQFLLFCIIAISAFAACDTLPEDVLTEEPPNTINLDDLLANPISSNLEWDDVIRTIDGVEMVLVPPGCFLMGNTVEQVEIDTAQCNQEYANCGDANLEVELPQHEVCFENPFWLDRTEVTNQQYGSSGLSDPDFPRPLINWLDSQSYCVSRNGRLPTEAEWEYAAAGPDSWRYPWGNQFASNLANFCDSSCANAWRNDSFTDGFPEDGPAGSIPLGASWVGALNMGGNVSEWTHSIFQPYPYHPEDGREADALADSTSDRTLKGASFNSIPTRIRNVRRVGVAPNFLYQSIGFRCMLPYDQPSN